MRSEKERYLKWKKYKSYRNSTLHGIIIFLIWLFGISMIIFLFEHIFSLFNYKEFRWYFIVFVLIAFIVYLIVLALKYHKIFKKYEKIEDLKMSYSLNNDFLRKDKYNLTFYDYLNYDSFILALSEMHYMILKNNTLPSCLRIKCDYPIEAYDSIFNLLLNIEMVNGYSTLDLYHTGTNSKNGLDFFIDDTIPWHTLILSKSVSYIEFCGSSITHLKNLVLPSESPVIPYINERHCDPSAQPYTIPDGFKIEVPEALLKEYQTSEKWNSMYFVAPNGNRIIPEFVPIKRTFDFRN